MISLLFFFFVLDDADDFEDEPEPEPEPSAEYSSLANILNKGDDDDEYYGFDEEDY